MKSARRIMRVRIACYGKAGSIFSIFSMVSAELLTCEYAVSGLLKMAFGLLEMFRTLPAMFSRPIRTLTCGFWRS